VLDVVLIDRATLSAFTEAEYRRIVPALPTLDGK